MRLGAPPSSPVLSVIHMRSEPNVRLLFLKISLIRRRSWA
jgi:hypothetical protein